MKKLSLLLLLLFPLWTYAQQFEGVWRGVASVNESRLELVFHLSHTEDGYLCFMDSPDQGVYGMKVDDVKVEGKEIMMNMKSIRASYRGALVMPKLIVGEFHQSGLKLSLLLSPADNKPIVRKQEPQPPYPYREKICSFESREKGITLQATLTSPEETPVACVVMVTGSGSQNRDEEIFSHKPFKVIADYLTRRGVAVLRYDDRDWGVEKEVAKARRYSTVHHLKLDALGGVDFLRERFPDKHIPVGIMGHSEGGTIAFMACSEEPRMVNFVVSMAGSMLRGDEVLQQQMRHQLREMGVPMDLVERTIAFRGECIKTLRAHPREVLLENREAIEAQLRTSPKAVNIPKPLIDASLQIVKMAFDSPWLDEFLRYDPQKAIKRTKSHPILAMNGSLDKQVDAKEHLGRLKVLLPKAKRLTIKEYDKLNHLFQPALTGGVNEYRKIETTISEEVLEDMAQWILSLKK